MRTDPREVLRFWFDEAGPSCWFKRSDAFDEQLRERFLATWQAAAAGECGHWRSSPAGRAAEIIVLDQFSRNLFRGEGRAFAQDGMALVLAQWAVAAGEDNDIEIAEERGMTPDQRYFTYMPFMHSESLAVHDDALRLFTALGNEKALEYEIRHRDVICTYGRYPGRNAALGRTSTPEERAYLDAGGGF
ncbi:MAG: DUF924 family protein [Chromatocurvus sp.]